VTVSRSTEYALRAVIRLAERPDGTHSTPELAARIRAPASYLSKVLQALARAGLVRSVAGRTGGFQLTRPPAELAVLDVVNAVAPIERIHACPLGNPLHAELCPLHRRLDEVAQWTEQVFRETSIAQLLGQEGSDSALCDWSACLERNRRRLKPNDRASKTDPTAARRATRPVRPAKHTRR
jgi:Rrf2 family transcriptional regulator, nitric oxide-sensitive transcriptional repressor